MGGDSRVSLSTYVKSVREPTINKEEFEAAIEYLGITEQELMIRAHRTPYQTVIDSLRGLSKHTAPIDKLRAVA